MPIVLPEVGKGFLQKLSVCIVSDDDSLLATVRKTGDQSGRAQVVPCSWLKFTFEQADIADNVHLHIDYLIEHERPASPTDIPLDAMQEKIGQVPTVSTIGHISARYLFEKQRIIKGGIVDTLFFEAKIGIQSARLRGVTVDLEGGDLTEVSWEWVGDDSVEIQVDAFTELTIDDRILVDSEEFLRKALPSLAIVDNADLVNS